MNIDEVKQVRDACIYRITFPNGKKYVGQTKDLKVRFELYRRQVEGDFGGGMVVDEIRNYGLDNIAIDILAKINTEDREDLILCLSVMEIKYIRSENSLSPNGYNNSIGGEVLGIPTEYLSTEFSKENGGKPLLVYNKQGKFLKEYFSIRDCAYNLGIDSKTLRDMIDKRNSLLAGKYMIREKKGTVIPTQIIPFKPKVIQKTIYEIERVEKKIYREKNVRKEYQILKYTSNGEYCGLYETSMDAALSIGRRSIRKGVLIGGYIFFHYDGGEIKQNIEVKTNSRGVAPSRKYDEVLKAKRNEDIEPLNPINPKGSDFPVGQYTLDGKFIAEFGSIREAASANGIGYGVVYANVLGKTRKGKGYLWRRLED